MSELKPCPFCGETKNIGIEAGTTRTRCICGACHEGSGWNSRPIEDALRAENERLKEVMIEFIDAAFVMEHINAIGNPKKKTFQWWNYADKMRVVLGIKRKNITEQDLQNFKDGYLKAQQALKEVTK
jgi:hypothetical protein